MKMTICRGKRLKEGGHGDFRFCGFGHFLDRFLLQNKFGFSDFVTITFSVLSRSRFSAKIKSGFRICY